MAHLKLSTWRDPYSAAVTQQTVENGKLIVTMHVRLRWWHPRLWWMSLRMIEIRWNGWRQ